MIPFPIPAFQSGADLGTLVSSEVYADLAALEAAHDPSGLDDGALGLVIDPQSNNAVVYEVGSGAWVSTLGLLVSTYAYASASAVEGDWPAADYTSRGALISSGSTALVAASNGSAWSAMPLLDLSDWANRPTGAAPKQRGERDGAVYEWDATIDEWIAVEAVEYTRTLLDYIAGTESSAQLTSDGWTVSTASSGTVGTVNVGGRDYVSINTTAGNSATATISRSTTSGHGIYLCGWVQVDTTSGTASASSCLVPSFHDGSRSMYLHGWVASPGMRWLNGSTVTGGVLATDSLASAAWLEVLCFPVSAGGGGLARLNGGPWTQAVGAAQMATSASTAVTFGDGTASASCRTLLSDLSVVGLS